MTFNCFACGHPDGHTNAGGLFCHNCSERLSDAEKDRALALKLNLYPKERKAA